MKQIHRAIIYDASGKELKIDGEEGENHPTEIRRQRKSGRKDRKEKRD